MNMFWNELMGGSESANDTAESMFPARVSLAMSYVPYQRFENLYDGERALKRGTLFACLDMPFYGRKERR